MTNSPSTRAAGGTQPKKGVVVEFTGLPGAGKTTLLWQIGRTLVREGAAVDLPLRGTASAVPFAARIVQKAWLSFVVAARSPSLSCRALAGLVASGQPGARDVAARFVQWQLAQRWLAGPHKGRIVLLDEGAIQALWSTGLRGDFTPLLKRLAGQAWSRPDVLVVVQTPPREAAARLIDRPSRHSRTQRLALTDMLAELGAGERLLRELLTWCGEESEQILVVFVDGTGDAQKAHETVLAAIRNKMASQGHDPAQRPTLTSG